MMSRSVYQISAQSSKAWLCYWGFSVTGRFIEGAIPTLCSQTGESNYTIFGGYRGQLSAISKRVLISDLLVYFQTEVEIRGHISDFFALCKNWRSDGQNVWVIVLSSSENLTSDILLVRSRATVRAGKFNTISPPVFRNWSASTAKIRSNFALLNSFI